MNAKIEKKEIITIVTLDGSLDTINSITFLKEIEDLLTQPELNIIVDCENLTYISSSGLRTFVLLQKSVLKNSGKMLIRKLRPEVLNIFELTGFTKIMTIER